MEQQHTKRARELVKEARKIEKLVWGDSGGFDPAASSTPQARKALHRAAQVLTEAIRLWPEYGDAYLERSMVYGLLREYVKARADASEALKYPIESKARMTMLPSPFEGEEQRNICRVCIDRVEPGSPIHAILWTEIAQSYWYEGDFQNCVREYELIEDFPFKLKANEDHSFKTMAYEAMGDYAKAESLYRMSLPQSAEDVVRVRMHSGDLIGALSLIQNLRDSISADGRVILSVGLKLLLNQPAPELEKAMTAVNRLKSAYWRFFEGLFLIHTGQTLAGQQMLRNFVAWCEANPTEWGVTMRWEVAQAKGLLAR